MQRHITVLSGFQEALSLLLNLVACGITLVNMVILLSKYGNSHLSFRYKDFLVRRIDLQKIDTA